MNKLLLLFLRYVNHFYICKYIGRISSVTLSPTIDFFATDKFPIKKQISRGGSSSLDVNMVHLYG